MKKRILAAAALLTVTGAAQASGLDRLNTLAQSQFKRLSSDMAAVASYKGVTPATPLGVLGIDVGVEVTRTDLDSVVDFRQAGADADSIVVPKVHVHKGFPFGLDVGAFVSTVSGIDARLVGAEIRYALADDGWIGPAFGIRASATRLFGVSELDLSTVALDAMLSKKLALVTPYIGAGTVRTRSRANVGNLKEEQFDRSRLFVGVNVNFIAANVAVEAEKMGDSTSLTAKVGFRF